MRGWKANDSWLAGCNPGPVVAHLMIIIIINNFPWTLLSRLQTFDFGWDVGHDKTYMQTSSFSA